MKPLGDGTNWEELESGDFKDTRTLHRLFLLNPGLQWKLKGSLESQLRWMMFCWGKHVKEWFPEVDTGERLRPTHEGMFS